VHRLAFVRRADDSHLARADIKLIGGSACYHRYRLDGFNDRPGRDNHRFITKPGYDVAIRFDSNN
jgi:hypothetical protein